MPFRLRSCARLISALALLATGAGAQISQFEGKPIAAIQYSPAETLDPADLARAQPLRIGEPLHAADVASAIDGLFATGRFEDIVVEAEPSGNGVVVRFVTKNTWFVGGVSIGGKLVVPPNRGEVHSTAQFTLGAPFRDSDVTGALESINRLLQANGLYEAQTTPTVDRNDSAQQVFIAFNIKEGKRAKYEMPVITGETKLSDNTILRATGWRIPLVHWWRQVTDARTRKGIQGVLGKYQKKERLTAQVELQKLDYDAARRRVRPHLNVIPGPKVEVKSVEAKVSKRVLKRYVPIFQEHAVYNDLLVEGKRNLSDYLQSQGYYDVDVDFRVLPVQKDVETIEYVIARGQRQKLVHVAITGNKYFKEDDIRERMFMEPASFTLRHGRYSEVFRRKDEENIANLYKSNGFRDVKVTSVVDRSYRGNPNQIGVTVRIVEGPQWLVDNLSVKGIAKVDRNAATIRLASIAGQPFADVNLAADRNEVLTYYFSQGFPNANFQAAWQPSGEPHHVNVEYTVTEGARQFVRNVVTSGLRTTRRSLVDKNITLHPGDPLSPIAQTDIQKRFYDLGIFARVDTAVQNPDGATDHKFVLYNFEEANRYTVGLGVGADLARFGTPSSTDLSSPAGATGFSPLLSVNASRLNLWGIGHTVTLRTAYSTIEKRASLSYLAPRFQNVEGRNITFTLLYEDSLNVRTFASKRTEASVQMSQRFSKTTNGLFRFAYRRVSVGSCYFGACPHRILALGDAGDLQEPLVVSGLVGELRDETVPDAV
ncbi:MAG: hypothetical protein M3Y07_08850, partial [Acidobacteriota bacterium]|nr:hypothetical protein [Acidobacteriota bacterium]